VSQSGLNTCIVIEEGVTRTTLSIGTPLTVSGIKLMTQTFIWTAANNRKIPLQLMEETHIQRSYARCLEIVIAHEVVKKMEQHERTSPMDVTTEISNMKESPLTYDQAKIWVGRFEVEAERRGIRLPKVNRHNVEELYSHKKLKREQQYEKNKKFDQKFW
jgi:hypothetical protein